MKIIVQAGGKGTRLKEYTKNKPKCLVPIDNLPMLFHMFRKFKDYEFIIIGDYKYDVLDSYLQTFSKDNYILLRAPEEAGNIGGIKQALEYLSDNESFMLIWSDIILSDEFDISTIEPGDYIGVSDTFECSWSFQNGKLEKIPSDKYGVAGCFIFEDTRHFSSLPEKGSFTKWLQNSELKLKPISLMGSKEVGTVKALEQVDNTDMRCRPYNRLVVQDNIITKTALTSEGEMLLEREIVWYKAMHEYGFTRVPEIYSYSPLSMSRIKGDNIFHAKLNDDQKKAVIKKLIQALTELHSYETQPQDKWDLYKEYYSKTIDRIKKISGAIPFSSDKYILINGVKCHNLLRSPQLLYEEVTSKLYNTTFCPIHGDCTLTNTLIDEEGEVYFIDARGYFGTKKIIGDIRYDWVKLYYSIRGRFDQFNIKKFKLDVSDSSVAYEIHSSGWEYLTDYFLEKLPSSDVNEIKLIHSIVWLSLASHAWEDYDSMCIAFYNGLWLFNDYLMGVK